MLKMSSIDHCTASSNIVCKTCWFFSDFSFWI